MILSLQVGQVMHTPRDTVCYPVYFKKEFDTKTRVVYITPEEFSSLREEVERLFLKYDHMAIRDGTQSH